MVATLAFNEFIHAVMIPGENPAGDNCKAGESELFCSLLDGVLTFDDAIKSTSLECNSCTVSECYKKKIDNVV